jgi:hypothetical protein
MIPSWRNTLSEVAVQMPLLSHVGFGGGTQVVTNDPPSVPNNGKACWHVSAQLSKVGVGDATHEQFTCVMTPQTS